MVFANPDWVRAGVREAAAMQGIHAVFLDAETISFIDVTAVEQFDHALDRGEVRLLLAQVGDVVGRATTTRHSPASYPTVQQAVEAAQRALS
jgi:hypothetical protein